MTERLEDHTAQLEKMWREFSEDIACASFLPVDEQWLGHFGAWLLDRSRGDR